MALACPAVSRHRSSSKRRRSWAEMKRILEASCVPCLRAKRYPSASPCRKNTTASAPSRPPLVPPRVSRSTPQSAVSSRSSRPSASAALTSRAPSTCKKRPDSCAVSASARSSAGVYTVPSSVDWEIGDDLGLDVVLVAEADEPRAQQLRRQLAVRRRHVDQLGAGDALRGAALVDVDVRRLGADHGLVRPQDGGERGDVAAGAVEDGERLDVAEQLPQAAPQAGRPKVVAVGRRPAAVGGCERLHDGGMRSRVVVAGEERERGARHAATFFFSDS